MWELLLVKPHGVPRWRRSDDEAADRDHRHLRTGREHRPEIDGVERANAAASQGSAMFGILVAAFQAAEG